MKLFLYWGPSLPVCLFNLLSFTYIVPLWSLISSVCLIIIVTGHLIDPFMVNHLHAPRPATGSDAQHPSLVRWLAQWHFRNMIPIATEAVWALFLWLVGAHLHPAAHLSVHFYLSTLFNWHFSLSVPFFRLEQTFVDSLIHPSMSCVCAGCSWVPSIHTHATTTARVTRWVDSKQERNAHTEMHYAPNSLEFSFCLLLLIFTVLHFMLMANQKP